MFDQNTPKQLEPQVLGGGGEQSSSAAGKHHLLYVSHLSLRDVAPANHELIQIQVLNILIKMEVYKTSHILCTEHA